MTVYKEKRVLAWRAFIIIFIIILGQTVYVASAKITNQIEDENEACKSSASIINLVVSSDSKKVLTNWNVGGVRLWDMKTGKVIRDFLPETDTSLSSFTQMAFSPDGSIIAIGANDRITLWDTETGLQLFIILREINDTFGTDVSFSSDGKWLFTSGYDGANLWDIKTGEKIHTFPGKQAKDAGQYGYLSNNDKYVLTTNKFQVDIWSTSTGEKLKTLAGSTHGLFTPDSKEIITWQINSMPEGGELVLWDVSTFQAKRTFQTNPSILRFSPDSNYFLESGNPVKLWEISTGDILLNIPYGFIINFLSENQLLLPYSMPSDSSGKNNKLQVWDLKSQKTIREIPLQENEIFTYQLTPDGDYLVFSNHNGEIYLWDIEKEEQLFQFC